ncbi:hypothetical protein RND71_042521 [Anisodus tanguticus]|uniref:L-gulonolactone oxidase n=1 Tax=Anisodus tanguticus TaxID=243964 RepID=A0AAE1UUW1_9SOLA|nr:hypothetical protein RND71_042521 [Anisodus tanguticus]
MPPPNPIKCNNVNSTPGCQLSNTYGVWGDRQICHAPNIVYPTTEEELRQELANANKNNLKVKVVTRFSHTIPKLACPGNSKESVFISTERYDTNIDVNMEELTVTADGGVGLRKLIDTIENAGLSLVAATYWEGVTVAGVISTGAHGSSWWGKGGAVHDHVIGLSLIVPAHEDEGYAKIIKLTRQDPLFNAAKVSLGLLGIISKNIFFDLITNSDVSIGAAFKRSVRFNFTNDSHIEDEIIKHARRNEFGDIQWYPSRHTACGFENTRNEGGKCTMASSFVAYKKLIANGYKNNKLMFTGYPVVGHQGKMQTAGSCLYSSPIDITTTCAWDPRINGLFFYESTAIFPFTKVGDFIRDVKKLRDLAKPESMCGVDIYNGFLFRFIKASEAYLGQDKDSVVLDYNYYRASDALTPRLNQDIWEEIEQMAFFMYGANPHWAKNRNVAFLEVQKKYPKFNKFVAAKNELDPKNMFSSEWSDEILFVKQEGLIKGDGCALEGLCICSEDRHCSPSNGYFCKRGLVYKEARVRILLKDVQMAKERRYISAPGGFIPKFGQFKLGFGSGNGTMDNASKSRSLRDQIMIPNVDSGARSRSPCNCFRANITTFENALLNERGGVGRSMQTIFINKGCQLSNTYGVWGDRQICHAPNIVYPTTEEELRQELANANKNNLKVKVVTRFSHTIPKLACPGNSKESVFISTERYDTNIDVNMEELTVTADGGVGLRKLIDTIENAGLSLVAATYWEGVTVAGVISTGAHGSSWWGKGGAVHDHVIGLSLIVPAHEDEGYAKIIKLTRQDPLFNAAKVSLGLLGIISKILGSRAERMKNLIERALFLSEYILLEYEISKHSENEFGDIQWYPSRHLACMYGYDNRVPLDTSGGGVNDFLGFQSNPILLSKYIRTHEKGFENTRNEGGKCTMASSFVAYKKLIANGYKNNKLMFTLDIR